MSEFKPHRKRWRWRPETSHNQYPVPDHGNGRDHSALRMASSGPVSSAADPESPRNSLYEENAMPELTVGDTAPDFTLPDAAGADVSLTTLRRSAEHGVAWP